MVDRSDTSRQNSTGYNHPQETNLLNVHKAMEYNISGEPAIRVLPDDPNLAAIKSAFGEPYAVPITPVVQLDGLYGLLTRNFETFSAAGGTADTTNTLMRVQSGTSQFGYGVIRSRRAVRYRPGQGAMCRFTAAFSAPAAGYTQRAGFFTQEQALQIGYDGTQFGIIRQNQGKAHIETLTVTTGASSSGNVTIVLDTGFPNDDVTYVVPVTNSGDEAITAAEISEWFQANASDQWTVEHCDGVVVFLSTQIDGVRDGTFSFSAGSTGAVATITTTQEGVANVNDWTYQADFNIDTLDGNGPSGVTIDWSKLNVFQINFRWLGAGELRFAVENPINGDMIFFHHEHYSNRNTDVHIDNPSLKIGYVAASLFGTGTNVSVTGASMMGAIEGLIETTNFPTAAFRSTNHSPNLASNTLHHGLTIHNRLVFTDKINTRELLIKSVSVSIDTNTSGNPVEVLMFFEFDGLPAPSVYKIINSTQSSAFYNDTVGSLTQGTNVPIYTFFSAGQQAVTVDLDEVRIAIPPNNKLTVAVRSTDTLSRVGVSVNFVED